MAQDINNNKPFRIIGLFSSCPSENASNRTEHEKKSSIIQNLSRYFFTRDDCFPPNPCPEEIGLNKFTELFHYEEYDVCHDIENLVEILIKMNLDQQYVSMNNETLRIENNIYLVVTYLDRPMIDLAYCLLLNHERSRSNPELLIFREGTITPTYEALRGTSFQQTEISYLSLIHI